MIFQEGYLSEEQLRGIDIEQFSGMIAGAGSGKTRVLTARYITHLEKARSEGLSPREAIRSLVAITFTRKAASEMAWRVSKECEELAEKNSGNGTRFWREITLRMADARISTIHSFCGSIIKRYPHLTGINPLFQSDDGSSFDVEKVVRRFAFKLALPDGPDYTLAEKIAGYLAWGKLIGALKAAYNNRANTADQFAEFPSDSEKLLKKWRENLLELMDLWSRKSRRNLADNLSKIHARSHDIDHADSLYKEIEFMANSAPFAEDPFSFKSAIDSLTNKSGGARSFGNKGRASEWGKENLAELREQMTSISEKLAEVGPLIPKDFNQIDLRDCGATVVFKDIFNLFIENERIALDSSLEPTFDDLIIEAEKITRNRRIIEDICHGIEGFLVDEFQDTDPLQWQIISRLGDNIHGSLFWVGDPKQSIYSFRGADVTNVRKASHWLENKDGQIDYLHNNFRTAPRVLGFINTLSEKILGQESPLDLDFSADPQELDFKRTQPEDFTGSVEILYAEKEKNDPKCDESELLARRVYSAIHGDISGDGRLKVFRDGEVCPARWSDIAVLYPKRKGLLDHLKSRFLELNIPFVEIGGQGFYETEEVAAAIDLIKYLTDSRDLISLVAMLRGPLFCLSDSLLFLASHAGKRDIREGLRGLAEGQSPAAKVLSPREIILCGECNRILSEIEEMVVSLRPSDLVSHALILCGAWSTFSAMANGEQRVANLEKFISICAEHDSRGLGPLSDYLRGITSGEQEKEASISQEKTEAVNLMTVHQSKGLEFPIVFFAGLSGKRGNSNTGSFMWDPLSGPILRSDNPGSDEKGVYCESYNFINGKRSEEEDKRLIYVAMTRARDHLIFSTQKNAHLFRRISGAMQVNFPEISGRKQIVWEGHSIEISTGMDNWKLEPPEKKIGTTVFQRLNADRSIIKEPEEKPVSRVSNNPLWRLKATDLPKLASCPARIWMDKLFEIHSDGEGVEWGNAVHHFFQRLPFLPADEKQIEDLAGEIGEIYNLDSSNIARLKDFTKNEIVISLFNAKRIEADFRERSIVLKHGDFVVTGTMDRVWRDSDGWHIVDYKSERAKMFDYYVPQLAIYRSGLSKSLGIDESQIDTSILFLGGEPTLMRIPEFDLKSNLRKIEEYFLDGKLKIESSVCAECSHKDNCNLQNKKSAD